MEMVFKLWGGRAFMNDVNEHIDIVEQRSALYHLTRHTISA